MSRWTMFSTYSMFKQMGVSKANIHFITDTGGHFLCLQRSVKKSKVLTFDVDHHLHFHKDVLNPYFVFGGDLTDRGVDDTKLAEILLDFKLRHPERVFLLVGNREASKARFYIELNPKHIRQRLVEGSAPFWLLNGPHQLPIDYVKKHMNIKGDAKLDLQTITDFIDSLSIKKCQLIYLKWMLEQNLGCLHTFEYHAQQLAKKRGCDRNTMHDEAVLDS